MEDATRLQKIISEFVLSFKQNLCKSCSVFNKATECSKLSSDGKCKFDKFSYIDLSQELSKYLIKQGYKYDGRRQNK
jgi:hypothetical protein